MSAASNSLPAMADAAMVAPPPRRLGDGRPFVLLDDARAAPAAPARLLTDPVEIVTAGTLAEVDAVLAKLDTWQRDGAHAGGYLAYEAGVGLEPAMEGTGPMESGAPLAWFARFARCERIAPDEVPARLPDPAGAAFGTPVPRIDFATYADRLATVLDHIRAGDIYQANLTFAADVALWGHPLAAYARLRRTAESGYGGVLFTGDLWLLSLSPELFFSARQGQVVARPMKGTARRSRDPAEDRAAQAHLLADPKQRAENLMIVDLIRNDLSRVAERGSVAVPSLFRVETYPTIHQMVSDVTARVAPETGIADILRHVFPCGSITGAPKIRAMQIIAGLEAAPRGVYTGSIGFLAPGGECAFNVAIRTLMLPAGGGSATMGLGSGIIADSAAAPEWDECLAKGEFVQAAQSTFDLIETMAFDPTEGIARLDGHLARLGASARLLGFALDRHRLRNMLQNATFRRREPARLRLRLSRDGHVAIALDAFPPRPTGPVQVGIAPLPVDPEDFRLRHKTSDRSFYDDSRRASGMFEVLFVDHHGRLTEGSFTNIFVERGGMLLTPGSQAGLIPGVLRAELLAAGKAVEADLTPDDLTGGFLIGNALRGLIAARLS